MRLTRLIERRRAARGFAAGALVLALPLASAAAQQRMLPDDAIKQDPASGKTLDLKKQRTFRLFGLGDVAISGSKGTQDIGMAFINFGLCGSDGNEITFPCPIARRRDGLQFSSGFAMEFTAGVPRSEFRKIRDIWPGVQDALNSNGYTGHYALAGSGFTGTYDFGPADRSTGRLFSGVGTTVGDNTCRDKSGAFDANYDNFAGSLSLLAGSDCPETWPETGFGGARIISDSAYIRAFNADRANFQFDFFRIPPEETANSRTLGSFSTYWETSDYFAENARDWGTVTRLGTGKPILRGFPLGLTLRVDAFVSNLPTLANAIFYQVQVINNSADVYGGAGVDYDSLYFGMIYAGSNGSNRNGNQYYSPDIGALVETGTGVNANCNGARIRGGIFGICPTTSSRGFFWGGRGIIVLKSPIGDLRNKLFTREGSPFYDPSHPHAGDTITFNHGHRCGYIVCQSVVNDYSERSMFGYIASREEDVLDGRVASDFSDTERWRVFSNVTAGNSTPAGLAEFNRYVPPGNWDYDKDGIKDTLKLDTCHLNGCVPRWNDTLPGGQVNTFNGGSGTGQTIVAGPFKLGSRDTTAWVFAVVGARDSLPFEAIIRNTTEYYQTFYASATPPPPVTITAAEVPSAQERFRAGQAPFVRLALGNEAETYVDPFLESVASKVESDPSFSALRTLNPFLADSIRTLARANVVEIQVYRSCDNGRSWDADGDCIGDEAIGPDGQPIGTGWQPDQILRPAAGTNDFPATYTDNNVIAGRTYLYSTVTRSRGATFIVRDSANGREIVRQYTIADTLLGTLSTSGPNTRRVYVPVSDAAGLTPATVTVAAVAGAGVATAPVTVRLTTRPTAGTYRLDFGNRFTIEEKRSASTGGVRTTVTVADTAASCVRGASPAASCVVSTASYSVNQVVPVSSASRSTSTAPGAGDTTVTTTIVSEFGFVAVRDGQPIFVSTTLTPDATTPPQLLGSPLDPGFTIRVDNSATSSSGVAFENAVEADGDTVNGTIFNQAVVQYQEGRSTRAATSTGTYEFRWRDDAFGPGVPFTLDPANPLAVQSAVAASLNQRVTADTSRTSAGVKAVVAAYLNLPAVANEEFERVRFPFTAVNATTGRELFFAVRPRDPRTVLLGNLEDTLRVAVPDETWVPGDQVFALEVITRDSIRSGSVVLDEASGARITVTDTVVAFGPLVLGCNVPRVECNPVQLGTPGSTGYRPYRNGEKLVVGFNRPFTVTSAVDVIVSGATPTGQITSAEKRAVRVVPNPYVVQSQYDVIDNNRVGESRVLFAGLPPRGSLRIYSVSGQFLQQLRWTEADLNGTGDLPYNLRTREGTELATGVYIYVIEGNTGVGGNTTIRGRFVVIR